MAFVLRIDLEQFPQIYEVSGIVISNVSFVFATRFLYSLVEFKFKSERIAFLSAVFFSINPASVFMSAVYTESLFTMLHFSGLFFLFGSNEPRFLPACMSFFIASSLRSNGTLHLVYFFVAAIDMIMQGGKSFRFAFFLLVRALSGVTSCVLPSMLFALYVRSNFCLNNQSTEDQPYCVTSILPAFYNHVQSKYWNVGLFRYYTLSQLPNHLLGVPMIIICCAAIIVYLHHQWISFVSLGILSSPRKSVFSSLRVFMYVLLVQVIICLTILHTQVSTRFLCSSPVPFVFIALLNPNPFWRLYISYSLIFNSVGIVLFTNFLPWT